jgi:hypothetical protein
VVADGRERLVEFARQLDRACLAAVGDGLEDVRAQRVRERFEQPRIQRV